MYYRSVEELEKIYGALDALPLEEKMYRLCNACLEINKGLPASVFLIIMAIVMSSFLSAEQRATLASFMRDGADEMDSQETEKMH